MIAAARRLKYRDFLTVALVVRAESLFPDNWIYIHEPSVKLGRLQNFKNWSPEMVPDPAMTGLGLEYFCSEGDELWSQTTKSWSSWASVRSCNWALPLRLTSSTAPWFA